MPEPTDPANARLALRRLVSGLVAVRTMGGLSHPDDPPRPDPTIDEALATLDADELADYEQVLGALAVLEPPRFVRHGREVIDLRMVLRYPDAADLAASYLFDAPDENTAAAVVRLLNADPEAWDRAVAAGEEPF